MKFLFKTFGRVPAGQAFGSTRYFASILHAAAVTAILLTATTGFSQEKTTDTTKVNKIDEVLVSAVRANSKTPVSFSNLKKEEFEKRNLGQDIPILMNFMPSVVTTSDAGNGIGYTGIRVRGSDATRVNVTINGVPYNDSESHGTFWVNMPDFASSVSSLQLQRGVGTSTNGAGAFGASLNMLTDSYSEKAYGEISNSFGSFNTRKHTVKVGSGLLNDHFEIAGRLSNLASDGYIDRAETDLKSYFLQGTYVGKTTLIKALVFGGTERTYQSWNGIDAEKLQTDRTYNSSGAFTDAFGNARFYDNETDNYQQDHYQLHWNEKISAAWSTNLALHYTKGKGYYENYKENETVDGYPGINPTEFLEDEDGNLTIPATDLIRQKWLDNDFYGTTFSVDYKKEKFDIVLGGGWNKYEGDHFGKVIWARSVSGELGDHYYDDEATKIDGNIFAKGNYKITEKFSLFADLQYRRVSYKADGVQAEFADDVFKFFNPKAGITFTLDAQNNFYFSYAKANREPNRTDYENGNPEPEKLDDYELGWRHDAGKIKWNLNGYYMAYKDQLILTGGLDDVGNYIRKNAEKSYRLGVEAEAMWQPIAKLGLQANVTYSSNVVRDGDSFSGNEIAFSPSVIGGGMITYQPLQDLQISWLHKYVGEQYLNNDEQKETQLPSYYINDLNVSYELKTKTIFKSLVFSGLVNNVFDKEYVSNGADYGGGYVYYYPQAGINFLLGLTLKF
ncbi:TonB-dependent receptor [Flavobacterium sp.]|uniref:TonB-dependent receptor n=1 Tax=Flavobacterium sp. TaxID=239 RepID=UPI0039E32C7B